MSERFIGYIERKGCTAGTPIHSELKESLTWLEQADLKALVTEGDPNLNPSPEEVQERIRSAVEGYGGCETLVASQKMKLP